MKKTVGSKAPAEVWRRPHSRGAFAALVMAGGRGSRLKMSVEKPLLKICGISMFDRVVSALRSSSRVELVFAAVTALTPATKKRAEEMGVIPIPTDGDGYVNDLVKALKTIYDRYGYEKVVVANADLPLLEGTTVDEVANLYLKSGAEALTVAVRVEDYAKLGFKADYHMEHGGTTVAPVGLNIVRADLIREGGEPLKELVYVYPKADVLVNVNTVDEASRAEELLNRRRCCKRPK